MPPKRKISGLDYVELEQTLESLKKHRRFISGTEEEGEDAGEASTETLDRLIDRMKSKLSGPQAPSSSGVDFETLTNLNINMSGVLFLKSNHKELARETKLVGKDGLWSSAQMYRHLEFLEKSIPREGRVGTRIWIDTFLFRASAMLPPGYCMVFKIQENMPPTAIGPSSLATIPRFADYTVVVAKDEMASGYFSVPWLEEAGRLNAGFFVMQSKRKMCDDIPQAVCELYTSGKQLQRGRVRGVLTNGHDWMFIILYFGADGKSASYKYSSVIPCPVAGNSRPEDPYPDLIAGILSHWSQNSTDDIGGDDWFRVWTPDPQTNLRTTRFDSALDKPGGI